MTKPKGGRWDGWDDPDYKPSEDELNEPIALEDAEGATPEDVARAIMRPLKRPTTD